MFIMLGSSDKYFGKLNVSWSMYLRGETFNMRWKGSRPFLSFHGSLEEGESFFNRVNIWAGRKAKAQ